VRTDPRIVLTIPFVSRSVLSYTGDLETQLDMQLPDETEGSKRKENVPLEEYKAICPRCGGKGLVVCSECQGTGEARNSSWVVVGPCTRCERIFKGFVLCPKCKGLGRLYGEEAPPG
jgi:DnaJ-class molecular chaperone